MTVVTRLTPQTTKMSSYHQERHKVRLRRGVELFVQSAGELLSFQFTILGQEAGQHLVVTPPPVPAPTHQQVLDQLSDQRCRLW